MTALNTGIPNIGILKKTYLVSKRIGNYYITYLLQGGQYVLELVDYYGGTFLVLFAAISEIVGVFWIYGEFQIKKIKSKHL